MSIKRKITISTYFRHKRQKIAPVEKKGKRFHIIMTILIFFYFKILQKIKTSMLVIKFDIEEVFCSLMICIGKNDWFYIVSFPGVHDLQMCELSLDETGLTRKKGAEILGKDFEAEWNKYGGRELLKTCGNRMSSTFLQKRLGVVRKWWQYYVAYRLYTYNSVGTISG